MPMTIKIIMMIIIMAFDNMPTTMNSVTANLNTMGAGRKVTK